MSQIGVLVAIANQDIKAGVIAESVRVCSDMQLIHPEVVTLDRIDDILSSRPNTERVALIMVGQPADLVRFSNPLLEKRQNLVVVHVDLEGADVQIALNNPPLTELLNAVRALLQDDVDQGARVAKFQISSTTPKSRGRPSADLPPLFVASVNWIHSIYRDAVSQVSTEHGDFQGISVTRETLLEILESRNQGLCLNDESDEILKEVYCQSSISDSEPLAIVANSLNVEFLEFKFLLLALSPELGNSYQRCIGYLLDDMSRRVGTMALYCSLLGHGVDVRASLSQRGALVRWQAFETQPMFPDDSLRLDPYLSEWILGKESALTRDPGVRKVLRDQCWPGATLFIREEDTARVSEILSRLAGPQNKCWLVLPNEPENWRAILEHGSDKLNRKLMRVDISRLANLDAFEIEDCATRVARSVLLSKSVLIVDAANEDPVCPPAKIELFLESLEQAGVRGAVVAREATQAIRHLSRSQVEVITTPVLTQSNRVAAFLTAAKLAGVYLTAEEAGQLAQLYPLNLDRLEQATCLVSSQALPADTIASLNRQFTVACRELSVEGISHIAERIEPVFRIQDVVLPDNRSSQLYEIVNHIRLAPKVLDAWKFGDQLPYGKGVTALFFGPSGTGKTMAAMGIANELGIQLLRVDLSRIVSKYIGDTEKNIDRVFRDAQQSGSAILIDEADALLGKRSEVKDSHDRYANIEIAYLLQRMEQYEGLAMLTSNMRQNLDSAFLRRIRFIIDFPRPDAAAREKIWRLCLPEDSHELDDTDFRQLARKIELTGGHIRQMTLRAAFLAASADTKIHAKHVAQAADAEFAKLGLPAVDLELNSERQAA